MCPSFLDGHAASSVADIVFLFVCFLLPLRGLPQ